MSRILAGLLLAATRLVTGVARCRALGTGEAQCVYFANHGSHLDALVIMAALPPALRARVRPVAARDYWGATRLRRFVAMRCLNAVLIDRHPAPGDDALAPVAAALAEGASVILFPEGTRNPGGGVGPFKSGIYRLAARFPRALLVPVGLKNLHRILPKGTGLLVPLLGSVRFGAALPEIAEETKTDFLDRARAALVECVA